MKKLAFILCTFLLSSFANAQASLKPTVQEKMEALEWVTGKWQGSGWISFGPNQKHTFTQTEDISYKLDNTVLQIEGLGRNGNDTIHNALALMTYDHGKNAYTFHSYTSEGRFQTNADVTVADRKFIWQMNNNPNRKIRYTIWLDDKNQWQEIGEMSTDGQNWNKFFEMTLKKVK
ncbi:hypothetical protein ACFSRY_00125 [Pontibacter locisalis]|uniref:DUF1579 domain-containing protein n=1 Tax=Pontibacter locisalis TaxID=1719035 RepID=A0ABW5IGW1_9BACT